MKRFLAAFGALWLLFGAMHFAHERASAGTWGLLGVGKGSTAVSASFSPTCAESTTYFARADVIAASLATGDKTNLDTVICAAVTHGWWALSDYIYALANGNATASLLDLKAASGGSSNASTSGSPTFGAGTCPTAKLGWGLNGTSQYVNLNVSPTTATLWTLSINSITAAVTNSRSGTPASDMPALRSTASTGGTTFSYIYPWSVAGPGNIGYNAGTSATFANVANSTGDAKGVYTVSRGGGTGGQHVWKAGSAVVTGAAGAQAGAKSTSTWRVGNDGSTTYSTDCVSFVVIGGGIANSGSAIQPLMSADITAYVNAVANTTILP